jgi:hypothetical protein
LAFALACGALLLALCVACIHAAPPAERLFFALQIEDGGRVVARPQLLGETGKRLTLRLVQPDHPDQPRLALELVPEKDGDGYRVQLRLAVPDHEGVKEGALELAHGEEREMKLADPVRPMTVKVLLMRVASPEFRTFIRLARAAPATS